MLKVVSIKNPCHEPWSNMTGNSSGRHCDICDKTVVDFTSMTDDEIKFYFIAKRGERTCGRFNSYQVDKKQNYLHRRLLDTYSYIDTKISHKIIRVSILQPLCFCF